MDLHRGHGGTEDADKTGRDVDAGLKVLRSSLKGEQQVPRHSPALENAGDPPRDDSVKGKMRPALRDDSALGLGRATDL